MRAGTAASPEPPQDGPGRPARRRREVGPHQGWVWLTEGVEDGLAVVQMMREPAWAVLGTSGFKSVEIVCAGCSPSLMAT